MFMLLFYFLFVWCCYCDYNYIYGYKHIAKCMMCGVCASLSASWWLCRRRRMSWISTSQNDRLSTDKQYLSSDMIIFEEFFNFHIITKIINRLIIGSVRPIWVLQTLHTLFKSKKFHVWHVVKSSSIDFMIVYNNIDPLLLYVQWLECLLSLMFQCVCLSHLIGQPLHGKPLYAQL